MSIGGFLRSRFPWFYFPVVYVITKVHYFLRPHAIYITDSLGGSFKDYLLSHNMPMVLQELQHNLDSESQQVIKVIIQRILFYPDETYLTRIPRYREVIGGLLPVETEEQRGLVNRHLKLMAGSVRLSSKLIEESVFYFHHGLSLLPRQVHEYIRNQHFIDAGAFVGDSALALNTYRFSKIFSLEISLKSIEKYHLNMKRNDIPQDRYEIINVAISETDHASNLLVYDTGSAGLSFFRRIGRYDQISVRRRTIDSIVEDYSINPKFIKADIEGAAIELIKGGRNTFKKYRPVISIAIYHNPYEFFEAKRQLEVFLFDYVFAIRKLCTGIRNNLNHSEVVLIGVPKEVLDR
jgi:FkbM family methyltransferase